MQSGRSVAEVPAILEPSEPTTYNWWSCHLVDTERRGGSTTIQGSELLGACRRNAELEKEITGTRRANELFARQEVRRSCGVFKVECSAQVDVVGEPIGQSLGGPMGVEDVSLLFDVAGEVDVVPVDLFLLQ